MSTDLPARAASATAAHELFAGERWPRRPWLGRLHRDALSALVAGAQAHEPVLLLTGDTGTGKSVIVGAVLDCIAADGGVVASVSGRADLAAIESLGPVVEAGRAAGVTVVVAVDDAHELTPDGFTTVTALLPAPTGIKGVRRDRVTLLLAGEFRLYGVLRAADGRLLGGIRTNVHLRSLSAEEVADYVGERLREASVIEQSFFTPGALHAVAEWSGGQPRAVNAVCASALREASRRRPLLTESTVIAECARALGWAPDEDEPETATDPYPHAARPAGRWVTRPWVITARWVATTRMAATERWEATKQWRVAATERWETTKRWRVAATERWETTKQWVETKRWLAAKRWEETKRWEAANGWDTGKRLVPAARALKMASVAAAVALVLGASVFSIRRHVDDVALVKGAVTVPPAVAPSPRAERPPTTQRPATETDRPAAVSERTGSPTEPATLPERPPTVSERPATIAEPPAAASVAPSAPLPGAGASPEPKKEKTAAGVVTTEPLPAAPILTAPAAPRAKSTAAAERRPPSSETAAAPSASPGTGVGGSAGTTATAPARSAPKPASAPARTENVRDTGEDSGAIIDWLLKEHVPPR